MKGSNAEVQLLSCTNSNCHFVFETPETNIFVNMHLQIIYIPVGDMFKQIIDNK